MDDQFRKRLQRLGVVKGFRNLKPAPALRQAQGPDGAPAAPDDKPAEPSPLRQTQGAVGEPAAPLPGAEIATPHGPVWVARRTYPPDYQHGCATLHELDDLSPETLALLNTPTLGARPAFIDTETTGLSGGAGTLAFLTGVGVWDTEGLTLHQVFLREPHTEAAALRYLSDVLDNATCLLTFNGQGFDLPLLQSRYILNRQTPRWQTLPHLDLLLVARKLWRDHLPSRRLGALEEALLGITREELDLPSWLIPTLYREYLQTGNPTEMTRIFYHNEIDILSLVTLVVHIGRLLGDPEPRAAAGEWVGLGRIYAQAGQDEAARTAWERALEADTLSEDCAARLWRDLALQQKRAGAWDAALALWNAWAQRQPRAIEPLVERAKYHEWQAHDCAAALSETERALARAEALPRGSTRQRWLTELHQRHERLTRKAAPTAQA